MQAYLKHNFFLGLAHLERRQIKIQSSISNKHTQAYKLTISTLLRRKKSVEFYGNIQTAAISALHLKERRCCVQRRYALTAKLDSIC